MYTCIFQTTFGMIEGVWIFIDKQLQEYIKSCCLEITYKYSKIHKWTKTNLVDQFTKNLRDIEKKRCIW